MRTKYFTNSFPFVCITISLMLFYVLPTKGNQICHTEDYVRHAVGVLKGIFSDYNKERAVYILHEAAEQDSMPYAMNALGLVYLEGVGVKKNAPEALYWLEEAGKHGIVDAYHNIGAVYKEGRSGIKQDFAKAYDAFSRGAALGSKACNYDAGFMLYKGLGCEQSYAEAIKLFEVAANKGHSGALYMLGLCYRNGYGTSQDERKAIEILSKAAEYGFSAAIEELERQYPENYLHISGYDNIGIPLCMPEINNELNDTTLFDGDYEGYLVVYDWSGEFILKEMPVKMFVSRNGDEASGNISIAEYDIPFAANILDDCTLKFKDCFVSLKERYTRKGKVKYKLNYAKLDIWEDEIKGELSLYSLNHREPEKPMYIQLRRSNSSKQTNSKFNRISVTPNPFISVINADIELEGACNVATRIFDKYGMLVFQQDMGFLEKGKQRISLSPNLKAGYYVLNITADKQILRTIIINEGGK